MCAMAEPRCPVCRRAAAPRQPDGASAFPFCSERCRQVDLGRWFSGQYAVPANETEPPDDEDGPG
jgi:endogenous inhibitor of DNA gyrase (YacG/DUF329 family)